MTEDQIDQEGVSPDVSRQRINELVTNYSDEELGRMVRAALVSQQQVEKENEVTLTSFRTWLESVGLGWVVALTDNTITALKSIWEALKRLFA